MDDLSLYGEPAELPSTEAARLALLLALDDPLGFDDIALAGQVGSGLPTRSATALAHVLGRAEIIGPVIPEPTLRRARQAQRPLSRAHSERLYELSRVIDATGRAFHGDKEKLRAFLTRPHPMLDDQSPFDLARSSSAGATAVRHLLARAEAGMPV